MIPIEPKQELHILPEGTFAITKGGPEVGQPQYIPLRVLQTPDGKVLSQWSPNANELELLKNGVPVTLVLHTFNNSPVQPVQLVVGGLDLR